MVEINFTDYVALLILDSIGAMFLCFCLYLGQHSYRNTIG